MQACVLLASGFEEIEAVTVIDVLRRGEVTTRIVGVSSLSVEGAHGIEMCADIHLESAITLEWDAVILPGGTPGAFHLRDTPDVQLLLQKQSRAGGVLAAICAAPIALAKAGLLSGKRVTSYPNFRAELGPVDYCEEDVVVDGSLITSRGPSTAVPFALTVLRELRGRDVAAKVASGMLTELR